MIRDLAGAAAAAAAAVWACWPFAAPVADPIADLIATHSPRHLAAIRAWHYLAPAIPVVGLVSVAIAANRVWLADAGRRPVASARSPWPLAAADPSPALVVGEVHHPVAERTDLIPVAGDPRARPLHGHPHLRRDRLGKTSTYLKVGQDLGGRRALSGDGSALGERIDAHSAA